MAMSRFDYTQWGAKASAIRGTDLPHAKLNPDAVRAIRVNLEGLTARQWGERMNVHHRTIEKVRHYETWGHVSANNRSNE